MSFMNTAEDCARLLATHLKGVEDVPAFVSFFLEGSEDCPDQILLFNRPVPLVTDMAVAVYSPASINGVDGSYERIPA